MDRSSQKDDADNLFCEICTCENRCCCSNRFLPHVRPILEKSNQCPICNDGQAIARLVKVENQHNGQVEDLTFHQLECEACGSEFVGQLAARDNKREVVAFRKRVDGMLSGAEIRTLRDQYSINQQQASTLFGGGPVAFSKYENNDVTQAESMDKLLRLVRDNESAFWTLVQQSPLASVLQPKQRHWRKESTSTTSVIADDAESDMEFRTLTSSNFETSGVLRWK